jgi:hypothetical protein
MNRRAEQVVVSLDNYRKELGAHKWRLLQVRALMTLFKRDVGYAATSPDELEAWFKAAKLPKGPIDPREVLSKKEIAEFMAGAQGGKL